MWLVCVFPSLSSCPCFFRRGVLEFCFFRVPGIHICDRGSLQPSSSLRSRPVLLFSSFFFQGDTDLVCSGCHLFFFPGIFSFLFLQDPRYFPPSEEGDCVSPPSVSGFLSNPLRPSPNTPLGYSSTRALSVFFLNFFNRRFSLKPLFFSCQRIPPYSLSWFGADRLSHNLRVYFEVLSSARFLTPPVSFIPVDRSFPPFIQAPAACFLSFFEALLIFPSLLFPAFPLCPQSERCKIERSRALVLNVLSKRLFL